MQKNNAELERKKQRITKLFRMLRDICTIFIALILADEISALIYTGGWFADMLVYLAVIAVLTVIGKLIDNCIRKLITKK